MDFKPVILTSTIEFVIKLVLQQRTKIEKRDERIVEGQGARIMIKWSEHSSSSFLCGESAWEVGSVCIHVHWDCLNPTPRRSFYNKSQQVGTVGNRCLIKTTHFPASKLQLHSAVTVHLLYNLS